MTWFKKNSIYIAWTTALVAMIGSLYFSNVLGFPPCVLCWYQRICMYPLVIILGIAILKKDKGITSYVLPLTIIGGLIAVYHNLLYYKIIPESAAPCVSGVSCTTKFIQYFGFVTIPFLSLIGFIIITACMIAYKKGQENV
jgi:disulfide bond formation protein DsbB